MVLAHTTRIPLHICTKLTITIGINNTNIPCHPTTGTRATHPSLHGQFQFPGLYEQDIIWPSQGGTTWHILAMVGQEPHQQWGFLTLSTHQRYHTHHIGLTLGRFSYLRLIHHQYFQTHPTSTEQDVIQHKTAAQRDCLLDIFLEEYLTQPN